MIDEHQNIPPYPCNVVEEVDRPKGIVPHNMPGTTQYVEDVKDFSNRYGIPWEVIPGISAGVGGLTTLGLPLTHRDLASSVALFTGSQALREDFGGVGRSFALDGVPVRLRFRAKRRKSARRA